MNQGLRLILFDRTCTSLRARGLSHVWRAGSELYAKLGRTDASYGASSWDEGLDWLQHFRRDSPIAELQFWGHGKWGRVFIDRQSLTANALRPGQRFHVALSAVRERLTPDALIWFRSCETFGANPGQDFASRLTDFFGCRAAGHTFVIGYWQSGLHSLSPGHTPTWSAAEGLAKGSADEPLQALGSGPGAPNTIGCLTGRIPIGW